MKAILIESGGKEHNVCIDDTVDPLHHSAVVWWEPTHGNVEKVFTFDFHEYAKRGYSTPVFTEQNAHVMVPVK